MSGGELPLHITLNTASPPDSHLTLDLWYDAGGSILLWRCFSSAGTGNMVKVDENTDGAKYWANVEENLLESAKDF